MKTVFNKFKASQDDVYVDKIHAQYAWSHWFFGSVKYPLRVQVIIHYLDGREGRGGDLQLDISYLSSKFAYPREGESWKHFQLMRTPELGLRLANFSLTKVVLAFHEMAEPQLDFETAWSLQLLNSHTRPIDCLQDRLKARLRTNLYPYQLDVLEYFLSARTEGGIRFGEIIMLAGGRRTGLSTLYKQLVKPGDLQ